MSTDLLEPCATCGTMTPTAPWPETWVLCSRCHAEAMAGIYLDVIEVNREEQEAMRPLTEEVSA